MQVLDKDKVSLGLAAEYVGISVQALEALEAAGWIKAVAHAGRIPVYLGQDLIRLKKAAPPETPEMKEQRRIRDKQSDLKAQIARLNADLDGLREQCTHPNVKKESNGSTGNYDRSQDHYWRDCTCPDCGKRWTEEQ